MVEGKNYLAVGLPEDDSLPICAVSFTKILSSEKNNMEYSTTYQVIYCRAER